MNQLYVKGRRIGEGKPLICVPIMKSTAEEIIAEAEKLVRAGAEMIEWRVDAFGYPTDMNALRGVLAELAPIVKDTVLIYTFRSKAQGGLLQLSEEETTDIYEIAAESRTADFIDVEYFALKNPKREIGRLKKMGAYVIASHHDFDETPQPDVMRMLLAQMNESGSDMVKLAVMPQQPSDVLALLSETAYFHRIYPDKPVITMSMGALGCVSRIAGETFGSCVTFGADGQASAPGQLPMGELADVLAILHKSQGDGV